MRKIIALFFAGLLCSLQAIAASQPAKITINFTGEAGAVIKAAGITMVNPVPTSANFIHSGDIWMFSIAAANNSKKYLKIKLPISAGKNKGKALMLISRKPIKAGQTLDLNFDQTDSGFKDFRVDTLGASLNCSCQKGEKDGISFKLPGKHLCVIVRCEWP